MFASIDYVHRAGLSLYFLLLSWNASTKSNGRVSTSVALVTLLSRKRSYKSNQGYLEDCEMMCGRISAQGKGLIAISYWPRLLRSWSFRDTATGCFRHQFLDENDAFSAHDYTNRNLRWVHRSAYDYISGVAGEDLAFHTVAFNEIGVLRNAVQAYRWSAQYAPMIHI